MKAKEILEMAPMLKTGEFEANLTWGDVHHSSGTLARNYTPLVDSDFGGEKYRFFRNKINGRRIIGIRDVDKNGYYEVIFTIDFKPKTTISKIPELIKHAKEILQVTGVHTKPDLMGFGIASFLYLHLVTVEHIAVISDQIQYVPGAELWRRLSKLSKTSSVSVYVLNNSEPLLDAAGIPLKYDGTNIEDAKIWTQEYDIKGKSILLVCLKD